MQDIPEDTIFRFKTTVGDIVPKEIISIPIVIENIVVALISLVNINKFSKESHEMLKQSWQNINASYSSLLSNERTRVFAELLTKTNKQLNNQSEALKIQTHVLEKQKDELQHTSTELHEQNEELEIQVKRVDEANKLKSEFP